MTTRGIFLTLAAGLALGSSAEAQTPVYTPRTQFGRGSSPTYSPYLNLLRPGNTAINYYGLVRPEFEFRNNIGTLQQQVGTLQQDLTQATNQANGVLTTGHPTQFLNLGGYFGSSSAARGGRGTTGVGGTAAGGG